MHSSLLVAPGAPRHTYCDVLTVSSKQPGPGLSALLAARMGRRLAKQSTPTRTKVFATTSSDESGAPAYFPMEDFFLLGDGDVILRPQKRTEFSPKYEYSLDEAISIQLKALQANDKPRYDHGIEVLYRFANFDPFQRSKYFGKSFDLGQFERFRRIMHIPAYKPLLNHEKWVTLSTLKLSERLWKTRIHVTGEYGKEEGVFEITMVQRLGGRYDGFWFTESLTADGNDWKAAYITF